MVHSPQVYIDATKNMEFFQAPSLIICGKYCKKAVRREILGTIKRISLSRAHENLLLNLVSVIDTYYISSNY
jgi:hypothetical protein